jgi:hypothetical protein
LCQPPTNDAPKNSDRPPKSLPGAFHVVCLRTTEHRVTREQSTFLDPRSTTRETPDLANQTGTGWPPGVVRTKGIPRETPTREGRPGASKVQNHVGEPLDGPRECFPHPGPGSRVIPVERPRPTRPTDRRNWTSLACRSPQGSFLRVGGPSLGSLTPNGPGVFALPQHQQPREPRSEPRAQRGPF